jgi:outer membrane immunogenic protein
MKNWVSLFAGIALSAVCAAQAQAADLGGGGSYAVVNNWAGPYVGGTLGFVDANATVSANLPGFGTVGVSGSGSQFGIGLIAGYNWQRGNQVFGIETDIDLPSGFDYFGTLRGRYGLVSGNWLYYGTAGLSFTSAGGTGYPGYSGYSSIGYIVGAGAETKINSHLAAGFEALYYGFTDDSQTVGPLTVKTSVDAFAVRGRITYQFDGFNN